MELEQDKVDFIKKIITSDKKYISNEDLYEDFFNETYKRSFLIIKSIKNEVSLESYLKKIVTTSIISVLKNSGRVRRTQQGYIPAEEKSLEELTTSVPENSYSNVQVTYDIVDLSDGPEEIVIEKEIKQKMYDAVVIAHSTNPAKQYMQLFQLRYVKGLKQKEIAQELNLSQSEISKRLLELLKEVRTAFDKP